MSYINPGTPINVHNNKGLVWYFFDGEENKLVIVVFITFPHMCMATVKT